MLVGVAVYEARPDDLESVPTLPHSAVLKVPTASNDPKPTYYLANLGNPVQAHEENTMPVLIIPFLTSFVGAVLGGYAYDEYKRRKKPAPKPKRWWQCRS